jgi:hypothetical protein
MADLDSVAEKRTPISSSTSSTSVPLRRAVQTSVRATSQTTTGPTLSDWRRQASAASAAGPSASRSISTEESMAIMGIRRPGVAGARPRMLRMASSVSAKPSSLKRPRALEMASETSLRSTMRAPSSSTLSTVPLVRPRASRTALGRVICPRSATVASICVSGVIRKIRYA